MQNVHHCPTALFFPNGISELGRIDEMTFELGNFKEKIITDLNDGSNTVPFTLEAYFRIFKLSRVRLYLMTKKICMQAKDKEKRPFRDLLQELNADNVDEDKEESGTSSDPEEDPKDEDELPSFCDLTQESNTDNMDKDKEASSPSNNVLIGTSQERDTLKALQDRAFNASLVADQKKAQKEREKEKEDSRRESLRLARKLRVLEEPTANENHILVRVRHPDKGIIQRRFRPSSKMLEVYDWVGSLGMTPEHFELSVNPGDALAADEPVTVVEGSIVYITVVDNAIPISKEDQDVTFLGFGPDRDDLPDDTMFDLGSLSEDVPSKLLSDDESSVASDIDDGEPVIEVPPQAAPPLQRGEYFRQVQLPLLLQGTKNKKAQIEQERLKLLHDLENNGESPKLVEIKRWNVVTALMELYSNDKEVLDHVLQFKFKDELGCDFGGLSREVYSLFWKECSIKFFEGNGNSFVPRHSGISKDDLTTIGKILHHSFVLTGIFPVSLNRAYIQAMLRNEEELPEELLLKCYIAYLDSYEGQKLTEILGAAILDKEAKDFICDLADRVGLQTYPDTPATAKKVVVEMANSELLQLPLHTMGKVKKGMMACTQGQHLWKNVSIEDIEGIYTAQAPEPKKKDELTKEEAKIFQYLKRYVHSTHQKMCETFLRYFTASNTIVVDKITVSFFKGVSHEPFPRAHTCAAVLELPSSGYPTYNFFKSTMDALLQNPLAYEFKFA